MGVSECSVGVPPAKCGSFSHKTTVLHRRNARATLFCRCLLRSPPLISVVAGAFDNKNLNTDFTDCADFSYLNP
jgi:hypothetical protein